ncbi:hypothetical protein [Pseudomonas sp. SMN5]|uniref:hypothetical protein n=1 Tax=Pseudomonas sp. SMN5 TaxID=3390198 RepID=UPI003F86A601
MTDYTELKRLAEAALRNWPDSKIFERPECERFIDAARPDVVLALIAENDRLNAECKQLILLECHGGTAQAAINLLAERDQLKAENGLLRQLAIDTGLELRKASSWICREVEAGTKSATHWAVRLRESADKIDAAMGKAVQP